MLIDAHHHLWRFVPSEFGWIDPASTIAQDFLLPALVDALESAGIDAAIAVQARQSDAETEFLLRCHAQCPAILGVVGWIDLRADDVGARIDALRTPALLGYRHVVQDEPDPDFLLDPRFIRGVRAVAERGLSYDLLVNHAQLSSVPAFLDRVGPGRFVLDHVAKPEIAAGAWQPWADALAAIADRPDIYCKLSGLVTEADHAHWRPADFERYLGHALETFGPDRLLWGSDWPVCLLAASYRQVFDLISDFVARHCPESRAAIFGHNAMRAYGIDERALKA